jgi:hypothetical protein
MFLINEMLDKLDECYIKKNNKSIFTEKHLKWFDPAAGMGNFHVAIYLRLMENIDIPDIKERKKHIIENMLYMSELNKKNVFICHQIFNINNEYKMNLYEGDTLKMDIKKEWGVGKFDIIIGNPPYQDNNSLNGTLWDKFVLKSFHILKSSGYFVFLHPSGWRNIKGKFKNIQQEILSRDLQYLEIHNEKDGFKTFNCTTRYDWYILHYNKVNSTKTIIKFQDGVTNTINVNSLEFIPNGEYNKIISMIAKNGEEKVNVLHSESLYELRKKHMSRMESIEFKYPCVYTINSKNEIKKVYSNKQHGHFDVSKLIWSNGSILSIGSYLDIDGKFGLTSFASAIIDKPENLQKIKEAFDTKEFRNLMVQCAVGQSNINYKIISIFKKDFWKNFIKENVEESITDMLESYAKLKI